MTTKPDEVSPRLERIEIYSTWLRDDADGVVYNVRTLPRQPEFETRAEACLREARSRLKTALDQVDLAIEDYASKPVGKQEAA